MSAAPLPAGAADDGSMAAVATAALSMRYDVALLDLDGVVYRGADPVPGAIEALARARRSGMRLTFVTNNASRTPDQVSAHLSAIGVPAQPDEVVTSAQAAATLVCERLGVGGRVFVVGGDGLRTALLGRGLFLVDDYKADPPPQMVVQGFAPDLRYEDLAQAALVVAAGAGWIATNADATLPTARGLQPGNGTLVAAVAAAAGRQPDAVAGKPERALVDEAVRRSDARRPLMVGDRLDTDIEGAVRADMDSLLVLTGVSTVADLIAAGRALRPTYVARDVSALGAVLQPLAALPDLPRLHSGGWRAERHGEVVELSHDGAQPADPFDAIRTLAVAAWAAADAGAPVASVTAPAGTRQALIAAGLPPGLLQPPPQSTSPQSTTQQSTTQLPAPQPAVAHHLTAAPDDGTTEGRS